MREFSANPTHSQILSVHFRTAMFERGLMTALVKLASPSQCMIYVISALAAKVLFERRVVRKEKINRELTQTGIRIL
jgi:hypothetical protein